MVPHLLGNLCQLRLFILTGDETHRKAQRKGSTTEIGGRAIDLEIMTMETIKVETLIEPNILICGGV